MLKTTSCNYKLTCLLLLGILHIVYSSVCGADEAGQAVEHMDSKFKVEEHIRASGMSWTMLRPTGFMEGIPPPGIGRFFFLGAVAAAFGDTKQNYIALQDIGKAAAIGLLEPERMKGKVVNLVGQTMTADELHKVLDSVEGIKSRRMRFPRCLIMPITPFHVRQLLEVSHFHGSVGVSADH